jgi:hypothetical protein
MSDDARGMKTFVSIVLVLGFCLLLVAGFRPGQRVAVNGPSKT